MDDKELFDEDEIIDLEDEELIDDIDDPKTNVSSKVSPKMPNITKRGKNDSVIGSLLSKNRLANSDKTTPQKLQGISRNNRSFPPLGGSSFSNQEESELKSKVKDKVGGKALTVLSGGLVHGKTAEKLASLSRKSGMIDQASPLNKYQKHLFISLIAFAALFLLLVVVFIGVTDDSDLNQDANSYVLNSIDDDKLTDQLIFYGYCTNENSCKKSGVYKYFVKLKDLYAKYSEECNSTNPKEICGVELNTALIIETMNYYKNDFESYVSKETGTKEEDLNKEENKGSFAKILDFFKSQKRIDTMIDDTEKLAEAQIEYVEETCKMSPNDKNKTILKYYQVSFDKYISYLAYGDSSTHPNYQGKPVEIENDICVGPTNDYISTEYEDQKQGFTTDEHGNVTQISGSGKGVDIVNYALQFVGNPYVYGGTSLTNGIDCSGFTQAIYGHFGISLPRHSADQINATGGTVIATSLSDLSKAQPGDLLVWDGHVGIYAGDNTMVHAQSKRTGIVHNKVSSGHKFKGIVRF